MSFAFCWQAAAQNTIAADGPVFSKITSTTDFDAMNSELEETGFVKIIVQFDEEFTAEEYRHQTNSNVASNSIFAPQSSGNSAGPRLASPLQAKVATTQNNLISAISGNDAAKIERMQVRQMSNLPLMALTVDATELALIAADQSVRHIQHDVAVPPLLITTVPLVGMSNVFTAGGNGDNTVVAILDTGVDYTNNFNSIVGAACFSTTTVSSNVVSVCPNGGPTQFGGNAGDDCGTLRGCAHGTHVAGIAAGNGSLIFATIPTPGTGVARNADVWAYQVFARFNSLNSCDLNPPCAKTFTSDQIAALNDILGRVDFNGTINSQSGGAGKRLTSVNMSLGGGGTTAYCDTDARKVAIDALLAKNVATVIASGNDSYVNGVSEPACISTAITVGSTTKGLGISSFTNHGFQVDLMAPGTSILSSYPGPNNTSETLNGTSMAAPHVAGAIAALRDMFPNKTPTEIEAALKATGTTIPDSRIGGTVNDKRHIRVFEACKNLGGGTCATPPPHLTVTPATGFAATGNAGGPFLPASKQYVLKNTGGSDLNFSAFEFLNGISVSPASGTLKPLQTTTLTVSVDSGANSIPPHSSRGGSLTIDNTTNGSGNTTRSLFIEAGSAPTASIFSSILPTSRAGTTGSTLTIFGNINNHSSNLATDCYIALPPGTNATMFYYAITPAGARQAADNTPVDVPANTIQNYIVGITPTSDTANQNVQLIFDCANSGPAPVWFGTNTLLYSASSGGYPDMVSIASALNAGWARIPTNTGSTAFGIATVNLGTAGTIVATPTFTPVSGTNPGTSATLAICQTNSTTGACLSPPTPTVAFSATTNGVYTFAVFVTGTGNIPFEPQTHRANVYFYSGATAVGGTSVAVCTASASCSGASQPPMPSN